MAAECSIATGFWPPWSPKIEGIDLDRVIYNPIYGHDLTSFEFR